MCRNHITDPREMRRMWWSQVLTMKNQVQPVQELKDFTAISWCPGHRLIRRFTLNLSTGSSTHLTDFSGLESLYYILLSLPVGTGHMSF